jgi:hypothetical protein
MVRKGGEWYGRNECCGKKAKGRDGAGNALCGLHLALAKKREEERRAREAEWAERRAFAAEVKQYAEKVGVNMEPTNRRSKREVAIDFDALRALLGK